MTYRPAASLLLLICLALLLTNCATSHKLSSIQIIPSSASLAATGGTVQFKAIGTFTRPGHPSETRDVTNEVTWESANPAAATISSSGLATSVGAGTTTITASMNGGSGIVVATASVIAAGHNLVSLTVIPDSQTLYALGETAQFIVTGTFDGDPITQDMTDQVTWRSTDVNLATINSSGLATAVSCPGSSCVTTITASATSSDGNSVTSGTSDLTVTPGGGGTNLPSLTVYKVGLGTGTVVSNPVGIVCGSGAPCTGNFVLNSTVTLTATPDAGAQFGGWSANCTPPTSTTCTLVMGNSDTVGVIFN
jgi:hypothetical protein